MQYKILIFLIFLYATPPRLGSDGERADGGLKATATGTVCLQTRAVARRRLQSSGRRHRNRSGGFCCFSPPKSREKSFPELYAERSRGFRKIAVFTNFFLLVLLGPKVPKASARRFPRECASRGAARGAQDQAYAPPRGGRAAARTLFFRVKRECGTIVPPTAALIVYIWQCAPAFFLPARRFPTWFRWRESGRRAESDSGGDGLLANPRIVARRRFQASGRRHRNRSGGFCCFSPSKSREKSFFRRFFRKPKKDFERLFAAYRHRKAEKRKEFFRRFYEKRKRIPGGFSPPIQEKNNQQRILPCRKAPTPSICRASSHRAVRS